MKRFVLSMMFLHTLTFYGVAAAGSGREFREYEAPAKSVDIDEDRIIFVARKEPLYIEEPLPLESGVFADEAAAPPQEPLAEAGSLAAAPVENGAGDNTRNSGGGLYEYRLVPSEERPPKPRTGGAPPDGDASLAAIPEAAPEADALFSVPVISGLEKGKYYVQLGSYNSAGAVEAEINRIEGSYPLAVQPVKGNAAPLYRVLLGPVSRGESGALLQRFKGSGYRDAFIRHEGL
jgi:hypothetical protein